jgi:hypothetical protein
MGGGQTVTYSFDDAGCRLQGVLEVQLHPGCRH